jgi:hypothetical protein
VRKHRPCGLCLVPTAVKRFTAVRGRARAITPNFSTHRKICLSTHPMDAQQAIEEAIEVQAAGGPPSAVTELFLAGRTVPGLGALSLQLAPFLNLRGLSLNGCNLGSLKSFPALPNLRRLELADNQLTGTLAAPLPHPCLTLAAPSPHPPYTLPAPSQATSSPSAPLRSSS